MENLWLLWWTHVTGGSQDWLGVIEPGIVVRTDYGDFMPILIDKKEPCD